MKTLILTALAALTLQAQQTTAPAKAEPTKTPIAFVANSGKRTIQPNPDGTVTISISLGELFAAKAALEKWRKLDIPGDLAWKRRGATAALVVLQQRLEEQRSELIIKYGKPDPQVPGAITVSPDNRAFFDELEKLFTVRETLTITPIPGSLLNASVRLSDVDIVNLEGFLSADEPPKPEEKKKEK